MELEISNLKAQIARITKGSGAEQAQISALEEKLSRTQRALDTSQQELSYLKKNLDRTTEKAVKEGSERVSAETKLATLVRESEAAKQQTDDYIKQAAGRSPAQEIADAKGLLEAGTISQAEFDSLKAKALG